MTTKTPRAMDELDRGRVDRDDASGLPSSSTPLGAQKNDGLGAHESVSEIVSEVFSGYACHSIEVGRRRVGGCVFSRHPRVLTSVSDGAGKAIGERRNGFEGFQSATTDAVSP